MKLIPLPAFQDNYLWLLHDGHRALEADTGDAQPVHAALQHHGLQLEAILVTHPQAAPTGRLDANLFHYGQQCRKRRTQRVRTLPPAFDARTTQDQAGIFAGLRQMKNESR